MIKKSTVVTPRRFRTKDAAHYLGMSSWALRQEVSKGNLPFISSGDHTSSWKFDVRDLDAWVERHRVQFWVLQCTLLIWSQASAAVRDGEFIRSGRNR